MTNTNTFAIVGGDKRQIALSESIFSDGYNVNLVGFENTNLKKEIFKNSLPEAVKNSKYIILPLPTTLNGQYLNTPYSSLKIKIDDDFAQIMQKKEVFCSNKKNLISTSKLWNNVKLHDYSKKEDFAINNAIPTAEGAIEIAMKEYTGTINGSKCLVAGFGRIGKVLGKMLKALGAKVSISARNLDDLSWIKLLGYKDGLIDDLIEKNEFDIIFNTIPVLIFDENKLKKINKNSIIIDLASYPPGGIDFDTAKKLKIKTIQALGLPGKVAPKTAGEIIKNTIYNIIREEQS